MFEKIDFTKVEQFVKSAGDDALEHWKDFNIIKYKDRGRDLSTNIDLRIEGQFHKFCKTNFPKFGFKGEEFPELTSEGQGHYIWQIDPIDGTKNFAKGIPLWSVTASLMRNDSPVFGIIYNPVTKQMYIAKAGGGAYLNGQPVIIPTDAQDTEYLQLAIDFFMPQPTEQERSKQNALLAQLFNSFYRVRALGVGSLSLAWLTQGHFGAYFSWGLTQDKYTDIAAGLIIAQEAGATVRTEDIGNKKRAVAVGSKEVVNFLISLVV